MDDLERLAAARPSRGARLVAGVLTPANVLLALAAWVSARHTSTTTAAIASVAVVAVTVVLIPYAVLWRALRRGTATDRQVVRRAERPALLLGAAGSVALGTLLLWFGGGVRAVAALVTAVLVGLLVVAGLSRRWKVSVHAAAVAGALAVSGLEDPVVAAWAAPALLLVGWARVRGGRHTVAQVLAGALVGASVSGSIYRWLS